MIEFKNVTHFYHDVAAIKDISFTVPAGKICVLIGPSGCGKTTTLKSINRMILPRQGEVLINGLNIKEQNPYALRRGIGYVIQNVGLFPHLSVGDNIGMVPSLLRWEKERINQRTRELLVLVDLNPDQYAKKLPHQLSGGEAQRVGVARALAADPPILLMDEPFGAVDPLTREGLQQEFLKIQAKLKKTVVFVTHDLDEAIRMADILLLMNSGKIIQMDSPEQILAFPANQFVRDFVGTDRALKKLIRLTVANYLQPAMSVQLTDPPSALSRKSKEGFVWVVNDKNQLLGWLNLKTLPRSGSMAKSLTRIDSNQTAISPDSTLKDALVKMISYGITHIPVIDEKGKLLGEVSFKTIQDLTNGG